MTEKSSGERLQKLISRAGIASRRASEELIRSGRVTVNGKIAEIGDRARLGEDAVKVDGKLLQPPKTTHTLLLNKPAGVVTTLSDPEGRRTVLDLVPARFRKGLVPVGRLDFATEGLLLLTTDGELAHRVTHPRFGCTKVYEVKVKGDPPEAKLDRLRRGFRLHGKDLSPVEIERRRVPGPKRSDTPTSNTWWRVTLNEGRTRQIREMFQRIGHPVQRLRRTQIGPIRGRGLELGALRELGESEVLQLQRSLARSSKAAKKQSEKAGSRPAGAKVPRGGGSKRASGGAAGSRPGTRRKRTDRRKSS